MKSDRDLLAFILLQIDSLQKFYADKSEDEFLTDEMCQDASLMKLMIIGEYSARLSDDLKERFSDIEWKLLKAARNFYAHAYGSVTWRKVWETLNVNIPEIKEKFEHIIEVLESEKNGEIN